MAGGMRRRGTVPRETLAERVANTRARTAHAPAPELEPAHDRPPTVRHAWYNGRHGRQACLVLRWRRLAPEAPWEGYVALAAPDTSGDGWELVTMWVSAGLLERADAS